MQLPLPALQVLLLAVQSTQAAPLLPQAVSTLPPRQVLLLSQQPVQWFIEQLPPQPSSAPRHLPMQSGTHLQTPAEQTSPVALQSTQAAPPTPQALVAVPF